MAYPFPRFHYQEGDAIMIFIVAGKGSLDALGCSSVKNKHTHTHNLKNKYTLVPFLKRAQGNYYLQCEDFVPLRIEIFVDGMC